MLKKAIIVHLLIISVSVIFSGCCSEEYTVSPDFKVSFTNQVKKIKLNPVQDTITGPFIYSLYAELISDASEHLDFQIMSSAYALSCSQSYINPYQVETASLILDRSFVLDGNIIPSGTNIFDLQPQFTNGELDAIAFEYGMWVDFTEAFLMRTSFETGVYLFSAQVMMEDGTMIESQDSIIINIQ